MRINYQLRRSLEICIQRLNEIADVITWLSPILAKVDDPIISVSGMVKTKTRKKIKNLFNFCTKKNQIHAYKHPSSIKLKICFRYCAEEGFPLDTSLVFILDFN